MEGLGFIGRAFGKVLELFGQKVYVFVEVSFNSGGDKPYCLTVVNNSKYEVEIEKLLVSPDGFPTSDNGWLLNESKLFHNQLLKPTQKIRFYLENKDILEMPEREFKVTYKTKVFGWLIPRTEESCLHTFNLETQKLRVCSTFTMVNSIENNG